MHPIYTQQVRVEKKKSSKRIWISFKPFQRASWPGTSVMEWVGVRRKSSTWIQVEDACSVVLQKQTGISSAEEEKNRAQIRLQLRFSSHISQIRTDSSPLPGCWPKLFVCANKQNKNMKKNQTLLQIFNLTYRHSTGRHLHNSTTPTRVRLRSLSRDSNRRKKMLLACAHLLCPNNAPPSWAYHPLTINPLSPLFGVGRVFGVSLLLLCRYRGVIGLCFSTETQPLFGQSGYAHAF